ncbi:hypothetical protein FF38_02399 [Lucilia cuprina]|uniref:Uncharacterized protein n=1 Tax=Lucilia cuprina TaxID=7375 RepID=A0A0L0CA32_LUCCU|nr:hypothetical protein FF38_02399 [Lucilia cuprina]
MWLYLFSILTIGSAQSLTIGYPFRSLLAHDSRHGQLNDKNTATQGFLVYLDNSGIERIVSYNYAEPVYAIHQISYINREGPILQALGPAESSDINKAQEAHFRGWSLQQYQVLKREIDLLREEGKEPSAETLLKFIPLEKIALTADYSKIAELPEIKQIREEHLNIWKQVSQGNEHKIIENQANDKIDEIKKSDVEDSNVKTNISPNDSENKFIINYTNITKLSDEMKTEKSEISFATKISTESEIERRAAFELNATDLNIAPPEKIPYNIGKLMEDITNETLTESKENFPSIEEPNKKDSSKVNIDQTLVKVQPLQVLDTPEVLKVREEQLSLVMQANNEYNVQKNTQSELEKLISTAPKIYVPQQAVDTAEVMRARDEHLRIVTEGLNWLKDNNSSRKLQQNHPI